jgi:hypothetical protein
MSDNEKTPLLTSGPSGSNRRTRKVFGSSGASPDEDKAKSSRTEATTLATPGVALAAGGESETSGASGAPVAASPGPEARTILFEDDAAAAAAAAELLAAAAEELLALVSRCAGMASFARQTQFMKKHAEVYGDDSTKGFENCVVEIMKKMTNPNKRRVAAKPEAANALSAALRALVENLKSNVVGAMRDPGASFRVDADSLFAVVMSWARASNVDACFDPKEIGKSEGEEGKRLPWLPFAQLHTRDMCSHEKCATYICAELLVKMCHNAASGATFRDDVSFHAVDLCAALTEQEETSVEQKSADGERTYTRLNAPDGWENIARELTPLTLGAFLKDLDGYPVIVLESKAVIVIAREYYEREKWSFEMWPDELIAHTGVHPLIVRYDGSKHRDGMPAYGVGQVSKGGSVFLVACVTAAGDAIYGHNAGLRGGPQYAAAHLTAISNVLISVCTNGELVEYDNKERSAFVANGKVKPQTMHKAVEKMMSGDYARDLAEGKSEAMKKAAKTRHAKKDDEGKSEAGKKAAKTRNAKKDDEGKSVAARESAKTRHAKKDDEGKSEVGKKAAKTFFENKRARAELMYVSFRDDTSSFYYQRTINSEPSVRLNKSGFDSELAAAVGLNDRLKVLRLPPENETWFNAYAERKQKWKEEWLSTSAGAGGSGTTGTQADTSDVAGGSGTNPPVQNPPVQNPPVLTPSQIAKGKFPAQQQ